MRVHVQYPEVVIRDVEIELPDDIQIQDLGFDDKVKLFNEYAGGGKEADYETCWFFATRCNIQMNRV